MPIQQQTLKIRPDHLTRNAVIYVRQSTLLQVRENIGSTTRQYDLVKRAQDLPVVCGLGIFSLFKPIK